jgi:hypothetical protein
MGNEINNQNLPLVLKNVDTSAFFEISPNVFILTSSKEIKATVEQCPNCTYFESPSYHVYKVDLCNTCYAKLQHKKHPSLFDEIDTSMFDGKINMDYYKPIKTTYSGTINLTKEDIVKLKSFGNE